LHERELAGAIDSDIEVELAFGGLDLGDADTEIANRIALNLFFGGLLPSISGNLIAGVLSELERTSCDAGLQRAIKRQLFRDLRLVA
jgi:hypothetical protein